MNRSIDCADSTDEQLSAPNSFRGTYATPGDHSKKQPAPTAAILLNPAATAAFDRLTRLAAQLLRVPVVLVSFVDGERQFFRGQPGLPEIWTTRRETALSHSFCSLVVESGGSLIVDDARQNPQFQNHPAVTGGKIISYVGIPLRTSEGVSLGCLCAIGDQARVWRPGEVGILSELAISIISEVSLHNKTADLAAAGQQLATLIQQMPSCCFSCGPDLGITSWNSAAARLFGYTLQEVLGRSPQELIFPSGRQADVRAWLSSGLAQSGTQKPPVHCQSKEGRSVLTRWTFTRLLITDGFIATVEEITDLAQHAQQRTVVEDKLREKHKLETLGTLAAGVAHEANNVLSAVLGNSELALRQLDVGHSAVDSIEEILKAGLRLRQLVQQILGFARRRTVQRQVIALRPVFEESTKLLRATLPRSLDFEVFYDAAVPEILADATQIEQIILNLVTNAWHALANQPGRVFLRLETASAASMFEQGLGASAGCKITVGDTGLGMDEATLARLYEPFFTTKPIGEGTGLGLSIVKGIVETHQGVIQVASELGRGSLFTIYFPAATLPKAAAVEVGHFPHGHGQRILLIDDEPALVRVANRALEHLGYQVSGFTDWKLALAALENSPGGFALAISDCNMSDCSGVDVAMQLRVVCSDLPIILATGCLTDHLLRESRICGIQHVLPKPYTFEELGMAVSLALTTPATALRLPLS